MISNVTRPAPLILVVEDDDDIQELLRELLELEGYQVEVAADGYEAIDAIARHKPRMILLDLKMPRLSGEQVIETIRQTPYSECPEIMLVSASRNIQAVADLYGIEAYLQKPYNLDELLGLVRRYLHPLAHAV